MLARGHRRRTRCCRSRRCRASTSRPSRCSASLPGASPETMASSVATPLERRFGRIAGLTEMTSSSSLGSTSITLQFDLDRDVDARRARRAGRHQRRGRRAARRTCRRARRTARSTRPTRRSSSSRSRRDTLPLGQVFDAANTILAQKISQVRGVGQVFVGGGQQPAVRVQVDPVGARRPRPQPRETCATRSAHATVDQPKGRSRGVCAGARPSPPTISCSTRAAYRAARRRDQNGADAVQLGDVAKRLSTTSRTTASPAGPTASARC